MPHIIHLDPKNKDTLVLAGISFPDYHGKKFKIETIVGPILLDNFWSGGSRNYWAFIQVENMQCVPLGHIFSNPLQHNIHQELEIPHGYIAVKHAIFQGIDMGLTFYAYSENITKFLPIHEDISRNEKIVLIATRSLKSQYRFPEANRETNITDTEYLDALTKCIQKGYLAKNKSITPAGRNIICNIQFYELKD